MDIRTMWRIGLCWGIFIFLFACSGGEGDGPIGTGGAPEVSGTAAVGAPIANKPILLKDAQGTKIQTTTDDNGKFKFIVTDLVPPFILGVETDDGRRLFSIAPNPDLREGAKNTVNVHQLTDVIARNWFLVRGRDIEEEFDSDNAISSPPSEAEITALFNAIKNLLTVAYQDFEILDNFNFISDSFDANSTGFDRMLDNTLVRIKNDTLTIKIREPDEKYIAIIILDFDLSNDLSAEDTLKPSVPGNFNAFAASSTSAVLVWNPSEDNIGVAGYIIYRDNQEIASTPYPVYSDTNLETGVEVCYTAQAIDGAGNPSDLTAEVCVTPPDTPNTTPPSIPTNLSASALSSTEITLTWTPPQGDVLGYDVYRGPSGSVTNKIATVVASSYDDFNLTPSTEYCYIVKAFTAAGVRSADSSEACATTPAVSETPSLPPSAPTVNGVSPTNDTTPTWTWTSGGGGIGTYRYKLDDSNLDTNATITNETSFTPDSDLTEGSHILYVQETNSYGDWSPTGSFVIVINLTPTGNQPPIADAGASQTVLPGTSVTLDGSASNDPENSLLSYQWTLTSNIPVNSNATLIEDTFVYPRLITDLPGSYELTLVVNDGELDSVASTVIITVDENTANLAPSANAGQNQHFSDLPTSPVSLDGSGSSDPDMDPISYSWAFVQKPISSNAILENRFSDMPSFEPDVVGIYTVGLVVNDGIMNSAMATVAISISGSTIEVEDNNSTVTAQAMSAPGIGSSINAAIDTAGDVDWYSFPVEEGDTYVVEVYDVANSLFLTAGGCNFRNYNGLSITVEDSSAGSVASQCNPVGHGNVHSYVEFTAASAGTYYVKVSTINPAGDVGTYSIRVLPKHDQAGAAWNTLNFEPNNLAVLAYPLNIGLHKAITGNIESRSDQFSTLNADVDWYRFEAIMGETYVVELFDVAQGLAITAGGCDFINYYGLSLAVENAQESPLVTQCNSNGHNNVHSYIEFTASSDGVHYIKVSTVNVNSSDTGTYSLRVLPKHDQLGATWDDTSFEPNNIESLAYSMNIGLNNAITSNIEARNGQFSTLNADVDWYRFEATSGETYVVELFDVAQGLAITAGGCNFRNYYGLSLAIENAQESPLVTQCNSNGHNNVHSYIEFTASSDGVHYIKVSTVNVNSSDTGTYSLRVLPKHDQLGATWDDASFEPNNIESLAYSMNIGLNNAITSNIEARSGQFSTLNADVDWYRFEATSGETYVVELFDVAQGLAITAGGCNFRNYYGLSLAIENAQKSPLVIQCNPNGNGNVHSFVEFVANATETHYIKVSTVNSVSSDAGSYNLRILPKHDQVGADWDAQNFEPNNIASIAYPIELTTPDTDNSLVSNIETRNPQFRTVSADTDWFSFGVESNVTYVVEIFDVAPGLLTTSGVCNFRNYFGLSLSILDSQQSELASQCEPVGVGNVHTFIEFTASTTGVHYINVRTINAGSSDSGAFSVRVR